MDTVHRYFAALYAPRAVALYLKECRTVVLQMTGNAYFPSPSPPLAEVTAHLDVLAVCEQAAYNGPKGSATVRNDALLVVRTDMTRLKAGVQAAADADITHAQTIIESAGMHVAKRPVTAKPPLAARHGSASGVVKLAAKAIKGQGSYQWQMSNNDQAAWADLPPTVKSRTVVAGLTPVTVYAFRFRSLTKAGYSDWSAPVTLIVH